VNSKRDGLFRRKVKRLNGLATLYGLCASLLSGLYAVDSRAENPTDQPQSALNQDSGNKIPDNHIGMFAGLNPSYPGSNKFSKMALPDVDVTIDKRLFINSDNGVGAYLINQNGWTFGPSVFVRLGRYQLSQNSLDNIHTIKPTPQLRLSGGYDFGTWDLSAAFAHDVAADSGNTFEIKASSTLPVFDKLYASPSVSLVAGDRQYMNMWYGVSEAESLSTRYHAFRPRSGFESIGGGLAFIYMVDKHWAPYVKTDVRYLLGHAGNSPLTMNKVQATFGAGISYLFD
jgi:outer membrane protein